MLCHFPVSEDTWKEVVHVWLKAKQHEQRVMEPELVGTVGGPGTWEDARTGSEALAPSVTLMSDGRQESLLNSSFMQADLSSL